MRKRASKTPRERRKKEAERLPVDDPSRREEPPSHGDEGGGNLFGRGEDRGTAV